MLDLKINFNVFSLISPKFLKHDFTKLNFLQIFFQSFIVLALAAVTFASEPPRYGPPPKAYHPAPKYEEPTVSIIYDILSYLTSI